VGRIRDTQGIGRDAATGRLARAAVPALIRQVAALRDRPVGPPHLTVVGHSYGAVVVTLAASRLEADELVLVGQPGGTRAERHRAAQPSPGLRCAVPRRLDPLLPNVRLGDLGTAPTRSTRTFGAARLPADDVVGHDGYFMAGTSSWPPVVRVVNGQAQAPGLG
jgi:pimeloyl-ACP methyl ester carboxylesterase